MDEFIKIVCSSQLDNETGNAFVEYFSPLTEKLKGLLSENLYSEFEELLFSCCAKNNDFYMTEGAKLAIEIMKRFLHSESLTQFRRRFKPPDLFLP
jgi:hypothetical protein|nr:MAG TPA: hypothetical protein [Caudoviricetes sp.]